MNCRTNNYFNKVELERRLTVTCSVTFSGKWEPSFSCNCVNVNGTILKIQATTVNTSSTQRTYNAAFELSMNMNNAVVQCSLYFEDMQQSSSNKATNVPDYTDTWNSSTINILCTWKLLFHFCVFVFSRWYSIAFYINCVQRKRVITKRYDHKIDRNLDKTRTCQCSWMAPSSQEPHVIPSLRKCLRPFAVFKMSYSCIAFVI